MRFACLLLCLSFALHAQTPPVPPASEIHQIYVQDQADRGVGGHPVDSDVMTRNDAVRRARTRILLETGALQTGKDFHDAAFIFQHSLEPDDYLLAHILATAAVAKGDTDSLWISAATLDRYLQSIDKGQVFGTQYPSKRFFYFLKHTVNPDMNNPDAKDARTTQEPYNNTLIPDALRKTFCVPDQAAQTINVKSIGEGKGFTTRRAPGCTMN